MINFQRRWLENSFGLGIVIFMVEDLENIVRRKSVGVKVGHLVVGGDGPVVVQSMTNTDTSDAARTVEQVLALAEAGSELVRVTVDTEDAAKQIPNIK